MLVEEHPEKIFWSRHWSSAHFISMATMALPYRMGSIWVFHFNVSMFQVSREENKMQVEELILSVQTSFFADFNLNGGIDILVSSQFWYERL